MNNFLFEVFHGFLTNKLQCNIVFWFYMEELDSKIVTNLFTNGCNYKYFVKNLISCRKPLVWIYWSILKYQIYPFKRYLKLICMHFQWSNQEVNHLRFRLTSTLTFKSTPASTFNYFLEHFWKFFKNVSTKFLVFSTF